MHAVGSVFEEPAVSVTVAQIRDGLATNLATVMNTQVTGYILNNPSPPAVMIVPSDIQYDEAFNRGHHLWNFTVQILVSAATDIGGQVNLDGYLAPSGSGSVKAAIESDITLGGVAQNLHVTRCSGYRLYGEQSNILGAEWAVEIRA